MTQNEAFNGTLKPLLRTEVVLWQPLAAGSAGMSKLSFELVSLGWELLCEVGVGAGDVLALLKATLWGRELRGVSASGAVELERDQLGTNSGRVWRCAKLKSSLDSRKLSR